MVLIKLVLKSALQSGKQSHLYFITCITPMLLHLNIEMTVHLRINGISLFSLVLSFFSFLGMQFNCACCNVRCLKRNKMITRCLLRRRQWHPTPVLLPGKSHGRRSLEGCSPWGRWGLETTERLHFHFSLSCIGEGDGNPLQCSCLENPRDRGAWWAAVYGVAQSRTRLKWLSSSSSREKEEEILYRAIFGPTIILI